VCAADAQTDYPFDAVAVAANYSDNCGGNVTVNLTGTNQSGDDCSWTLTYTYDVVDVCGNTLTGESITHTGSDQTAPTLVSGGGNMTVTCDAIPDAMAPIYGDNCSTSGVTVTLVSETVNGDTITRVWEAEDACGNASGTTQVITVTAQPNLTQITDPDICNDSGVIDLFDYLSVTDPSVNWVVESNNVSINADGTFDPIDLEENTNYIFSYTIPGDFGCDEITEVTITILDCIILPCDAEDIQISKAVTPNGDLYNEYFEIGGIDLVACGFTTDVKIFNRWGALVFEANNYQNDWNGKAKSSIGGADTVPNGTYYYIVTLKDGSGLVDTFTGPIYFGTK